MTAVGNPSGEEDAKEWIWAALTGLLLLAGAYIILNVINPQILNLTLPTLKNVSTTAGGGIFGDNNASSTDTATWGCTASNNIVSCSPGGKSDCSDVPNGACSGKLCVQTTVSQCGTTANPTTQSTCARASNGGTTGTCPDVNGQHQSCCYFTSSNSSAFCAAVDSCDKISQTDGTCQATANGGSAGICPDADGQHQNCCSGGDGGAYCSPTTPCAAP